MHSIFWSSTIERASLQKEYNQGKMVSIDSTWHSQPLYPLICWCQLPQGSHVPCVYHCSTPHSQYLLASEYCVLLSSATASGHQWPRAEAAAGLTGLCPGPMLLSSGSISSPSLKFAETKRDNRTKGLTACWWNVYCVSRQSKVSVYVVCGAKVSLT